MKVSFLFIIIIFLFSCTNKKANLPLPSAPDTFDNSCVYKSNSTISYSSTIGPLLSANCLPCHSCPGAICLDSYASVKANALGDNLARVIVKNPNTPLLMPPPPQASLDSCEVKAINLWITQGCLNN